MIGGMELIELKMWCIKMGNEWPNEGVRWCCDTAN